MSRTGLVVLGASVISLAAGAGVGYFVARNRLEEQYRELSEREIAEAKKFYSVLYKKTDETPEEAVTRLIPNEAEAAKALRSYQGTDTPVRNEDLHPPKEIPWSEVKFKTKEAVEEEPEVIEQNVFDDPDAPPNFPDFEVEVRNRTEEAPYVITQEEFLENETSYAQETLTYFEGDSVLVDQRDVPIEDPNSTVGLDSLVKFGQWSNDKNIVYVRNDVLDMEYEIVKSNGKYSVDVLGLPEEKPASKPRRRSSKARTGGGDDG